MNWEERFNNKNTNFKFISCKFDKWNRVYYFLDENGFEHKRYVSLFEKNPTASVNSAIDKKSFIINKFPNKNYDFSKFLYTGNHNKSLVLCFKHNEFLITPNNLIKGYGCPHCGHENRNIKLLNSSKERTNKAKNNFLERAHNKYGSRFIYDMKDYECTGKNINIVCLKHNYKFKQTPSNHLSKHCLHACPKCAIEEGSRIHPGGMSGLYKNKPETLVYIYFMKLEDDNGIFYKIGLTTRNPKLRKNSLGSMKSKEILETIRAPIKELFPMEQDLHKWFKELNINYEPEILRGNGMYECFKW